MASTPLPTDDHEIDRGAGLPTDLRPIDVRELAAQQLGAAEGASEMPRPATPNEEDAQPPLPTEEDRLSDAERIALQRLDGSADEPLKVPAPATPNEEEDVNRPLPMGVQTDAGQIASERPGGAAEDASQVLASAVPNDEDADHALPMGVRLSDAESIALQRLDGAEGSLEEALAIAPAPRPGPSLVERIELVGDGLSAETIGPFSPPAIESREQAAEAGHVPEPTTASQGREPGVTFQTIAAPSSPTVAAAWTEPPLQVAPMPAAATAPTPEAGAPDNVRPLTSALDAAAKLAADANAAAEALANLKRLLERQLPNVAASPLPSLPGEPTPAIEPTPAPFAVTPTAAPSAALPLHAVRDGSGRRTLRPAMPAPLPSRPKRPERTRLDVRGFLAGFALSWAFGVVLYLYMTSG